MKSRIASIALSLSFFLSSPTLAEPGWHPTVVATGALRKQIRDNHILARPYRPLHFYGNTVRRVHYRGKALPSITDLSDGFRVLTLRQ